MNYPIRLSTKKTKKYDIYYNNHWISFGQKGYEHYKTSHFIPQNIRHEYREHLDQKRRELYIKRASKIKDSKGHLTYMNQSSPNYYAYHFLWGLN